MKYATPEQVTAVANKYNSVGGSCGLLYAVDANGDRVTFGVKLYRNTLHNLAVSGVLKYNGDFTYSVK